MATVVLSYVQNYWPFSYFKFDDLRVSDALVKKLPIPEHTKRFVYAVEEPDSGSVIYVLCVQNLSERSALDAEWLIRAVEPDAVVAQVGSSSIAGVDAASQGTMADEYCVPTSAFEVIKRCFLHRIDKEEYEYVAGNLVLKEIFGTGFNGHVLSAKKAAQEVGASFLLLDSPFDKTNSDGTSFLEPKGLVARGGTGTSTTIASLWRSSGLNDVEFQVVKSLTTLWTDSASSHDVNSDHVQARDDYEVPEFSLAFYPLLVDLHDVFSDLPSMRSALAHAQKMLCDIKNGEVVDTKLLSEVYVFRIAVEALRIALNSASRLPSRDHPADCELSKLPLEEKSRALVAHAVRSQASRYKSIVVLIDANGLAGLRKHWKTRIPMEVKDMVEQMVTGHENEGGVLDGGGKKLLISEKPMVALGAGVSAVLGVSYFSKFAPASTAMKILTFKVPISSLKLMITQTNKIVSLAFGKTFAPFGVRTSVFKAAVSAKKVRAVAHTMIASAERSSLSAMRTSFYEIMRRRQVRPIGLVPWATLGFSVVTCAGLVRYGDAIEYAVESVPAAASIASLGRGLESLHQASLAIGQAESSRIQKSIESLLLRFRQMKLKKPVNKS